MQELTRVALPEPTPENPDAAPALEPGTEVDVVAADGSETTKLVGPI